MFNFRESLISRFYSKNKLHVAIDLPTIMRRFRFPIALKYVSFPKLASDCRTLFFKEYPQQNKILENHVITNLTVSNEQQCRSECYNHHDCISYNTGPSPQQQPGMILCQLNNASRHQNPLDYKNKLGFTHRGAEV